MRTVTDCCVDRPKFRHWRHNYFICTNSNYSCCAVCAKRDKNTKVVAVQVFPYESNDAPRGVAMAPSAVKKQVKLLNISLYEISNMLVNNRQHIRGDMCCGCTLSVSGHID